MDLHDHETGTRDIIAAQVAQIERATGQKVELPAIVKDRLGFRRLKDPPEPSQSDDTPQVSGREPPSGTSWGDDEEE